MHEMPEPPIAPVRPHRFTLHGATIDDPYHWLRDPAYPDVQDPAILAYLAAENRWFEAWMAPHQTEVAALLAELKGRVRDDDAGVPWADGAWTYWWRFQTGAQYRDWYRVPREGGAEQLILSEGAQARGHPYFRLGAFAVSPDGAKLAFGRDRTGDERFELVIRDLDSGAEDIVTDQMLGDLVWAADSRSLLWVEASAQWRPVSVFHHRLGTPRADDRLLFHETDPVWRVDVGHTRDRRWLLIESGSFDASEVRLLDAAAPDAPARLVRPRQAGVRYQVDGTGDTLFIRTNDAHVNFRIATARADTPHDWKPLIDGADQHYLRGMAAFSGFLAISERLDGLDQIRLHFADGGERRVRFPEASYTVELGMNAEADASLLRLNYSSMVTPDTVFDYDVAADRLIARKVRAIPSGYDPAAYRTERLLAPARDGTLIPVSVLYRADYRRDGSAPLHCYGYGAYGHAIPPSFSASRLSLVDRGFAYAILHIRGGDDLGYQWYLDGKLERRANTFHDFIDATHFLHWQGFGAPGRTSASGGSAGGWLMGYVANAAPELWRAIVAHVPFVDVLNTMLDDTLPLTPGEYPEWGDPRTDAAAFHRLRALSPYENVAAIDYPAMLVTAGLHDPRVTYWEPAKWVARLRAVGTGGRPILLKTNMEAGHGGRSGRFEALGETAEEYAFLLALFDDVARCARP